ncbi:MAG: class I SAM-dependent methyltransferase [Caldisericia bacterium]
MKAEFANMIRCKNCGVAGKLSEIEDGYSCGVCGEKYLVQDGYVDFLKIKKTRDTLAQKIMKWNPIVKIYEGKLWRNSGWEKKLFGISLADEMKIIEEIQSTPSNAKSLDVACGPGLYARMMARNSPGGCVIGFDYSPQMLTIAVKYAKRDNLDNIMFMRGDAHKLQFPDNTFDGINCTGALHLFHDVGLVLSEMNRVLKPGGKISIACGRRRKKGGLRPSEKMLSISTFDPVNLVKTFGDAGFDVEIKYANNIWIILGGEKI